MYIYIYIYIKFPAIGALRHQFVHGRGQGDDQEGMLYQDIYIYMYIYIHIYYIRYICFIHIYYVHIYATVFKIDLLISNDLNSSSTP